MAAQTGSIGLWRNANYVRYRVARVTSLLGSQLSGIAYPLLVLHLGGSAAQAGAVASASMITRVLCQLPGGHLADRFDRRVLMLGMDLIRLIAVGSIPLTAALGHLGYAQLIVVATIEGAASAVFGPAATGMIRQMVPADQLTRALAQTQGFTAMTALAGPAIGGLCYAIYPMLPFQADAASYGLSAVLLVGLMVAKPAEATSDRRFTAGVRWLLGKPRVLRVLAFAAALNLVGAAAQVAVVLVLREHGTGTGLIGAVMSFAGGGAVVGALLAGKIMKWLDPPRLCLLVGAAWVAGFAVFAATSSPWVIAPVLALLFMLAPATGVMLATITVGEAPSDLLGRVSTAEQTVSTSLATLGPVLAGLFLEALGSATMWIILGSCCLLVTLVAVVPLLRGGIAPAASQELSADPEAVGQR